MEIHRYEKVWIAVSLVFIVGLIASVVYGVTAANVGAVGNAGTQVNSSDLTNSQFADPGGHWDGPDHYVVHVIARQFLFQPGTERPITVPANATVTFYVTSADVVHGFEVVGTDVNVMAIPGQVTVATTEFDHPTTYGIVCNEYCGAGHQDMQGQIVVVPRSVLPRRAGANGTTATQNDTAPLQATTAGGVTR